LLVLVGNACNPYASALMMAVQSRKACYTVCHLYNTNLMLIL